MKILFDLSASQPQGAMKINGGGGYSVIMFRKLVETIGAGFIEVLFNENNPDNTDMIAYCRAENIIVHYFKSIEDFNHRLEDPAYTVLVLPVCYPEYHDLRVAEHIRIVSVIHDLCHVYQGKLRIKHGIYLKRDGFNWLRKIRNHLRARRNSRNYIDWHNKVIHLNHNQTVVTVTCYSKCAMLHYLDFDSPEDIKVFYSPIQKTNRCSSDVSMRTLQKYSLETDRYLMLSSTCRSTKNNTIVLLMLDKLFSSPKYATLLSGYRVLALGTDESYRNYFSRKLKNRERFVFENYVGNEELIALYQNAHLFLFPSVLEGFGLPPVEAMQCGTVSACSTAMSIPEVCGDAAIYFDPYDEESILLAILKSFDRDLMTALKKAGRARSANLLKRGNDDLDRLVALIVQGNEEDERFSASFQE